MFVPLLTFTYPFETLRVILLLKLKFTQERRTFQLDRSKGVSASVEKMLRNVFTRRSRRESRRSC